MLWESLFLAGRFVPRKLKKSSRQTSPTNEPKKRFKRHPGCQKQNNISISIHFKLSGGVWVHQHAAKKSFPIQLKLASSKGIPKKNKKQKWSETQVAPLFKQFTATIFCLFFPEETTEKRLFLVWFLILIPNPTEKDPHPSCWSHSRTRKRLSQPNGKGFLGWENAALRGWQFSGSCTFHQKYWESRWGYIWTCQYHIYMSYILAEKQYFTNLDSLK